MENKEGENFTINRQRIKIYLGHAESVHEVVEAYHVDEVLVIRKFASCHDVKLSASWEATQGVCSRQ